MESARSLLAVTGPTPQTFDGQRVQELQLTVGRHQQQAVGLRHSVGDLGEELRPGDTHGDGQADLLEDLSPQSDGDPRCRHPSAGERRPAWGHSLRAWAPPIGVVIPNAFAS
jgi:hypothetical protein